MREERLRATAGLRSAQTLSSWRGLSGRRYIVSVHPLDLQELMEVTNAVILAVSRDESGVAHIVDSMLAGVRSSGDTRMRWLDKVREHGACELHIHRLADTKEHRREILTDLCEKAGQTS